MPDHTTEFQSTFRQLVRCSQVAKDFAQWLAKRSYGTTRTKVRVASQNTGAEYGEIIALFKLLGTLGFGKFVKGSHGHESHMVWATDIKSLAQGA